MTATIAQPATRTAPWAHQEEAAAFARQRRTALLAHGMGSGKSLTSIVVLEREQAMRVLVLCPKSVVDVWPDQLAQHAGRQWHTWAGDVQGARGPLTNPSVPKRVEALIQADTAAQRLRRPFMAVVNYEASHVGQMDALLTGTPWDALIIDESHRIKSPTGKASKLAAKVAQRVRARNGIVLALTGTPMPHSPLDLFAQLRALDGGGALGTSYRAFCQRYGQADDVRVAGGAMRTVYKGMRPDRYEDFTRRVAPRIHQVATSDVLDLPDVRDQTRSATLSPKARKVYDSLERDLIADIDTGVVTAANAMVLVTRLCQATSGYAADFDTGAPVDLDGTPDKARLLEDLLTDLPVREPVVVFARFHHDLDHIEAVCERTGRTYGELSGRRRDGLHGPRMSDQIDVLGAQLKSGGVGIDLTRAAYGIYYSVGFELADYEQSRARLHRPGQSRPVLYTHLIVKDSIDHAVYGALRSRQDVITKVINHLKGATA